MTRPDILNYLKCRELYRLTAIEKQPQFEPKLLTRAILENGLPMNNLGAMLASLDKTFETKRAITDGDETPYELALRERKIIIAISAALYGDFSTGVLHVPVESYQPPNGFFRDSAWIEYRCFSHNHQSEIEHALNDPLLDLASSLPQETSPAERKVGIIPIILGSVRTGSYTSVLVRPYVTTTGQLTTEVTRGKDSRRTLTEEEIPKWIEKVTEDYIDSEVFPTVALRPYDEERAQEALGLIREIEQETVDYTDNRWFRNSNECLKYGKCVMYEHCWRERPW